MELTKHQEEIQAQGIEILKTNKRLLIKGSAGVGKTFLVKSLIKALIEQKVVSKHASILCTAPTNKAVAVLKSKVGSAYQCDTIHKALKIKRKISKNGKVYFSPDADNTRSQPSVDLLILDESSMVNKEILGHLEDWAIKKKVIVIFLGDQKQLPPVGEINSPIFNSNYPTVELLEIIRQGEGNPIIELSNDLSRVDSGKDSIIEGKGYTYTMDITKIVDSLAFVNGTDDMKYLAWTNKEVDRINNLVRRRIYNQPNKVEVGEVLVLSAPYGMHYTNKEVKVHTIENVKIDIKVYNNISEVTHTFNCLVINGNKKPKHDIQKNMIGTKEEWDDKTLIILDDRSEILFEKFKAKVKTLAVNKVISWFEYFTYIEYFTSFTYNHAITIHRSQGSTYKKTIINIGDVNKNRKEEKENLLYTGVTRASDLLILYNI